VTGDRPVAGELERRYRRVLRYLPAAYRAVWQEEMVATLLDRMATDDPERAEFLGDFGRPDRGEVASVLLLAVRLRLGGTGALPGYRPCGDALRLVALLGLLVQSAFGATVLCVLWWGYGRVPGLVPPPEVTAFLAGRGWAAVLCRVLTCASVPAFGALVCGYPRAARALAALSLAAAMLLPVVDRAWAGGWGATRVYVTAVDPALLVALWAYTRDAPAVPRRPWLVAGAAGAGLTALAVLSGLPGVAGAVLDWPGLCCAALAGTAGYHLVRAARGRAPVPPRWALALAALAPVVLGYRLLTTADLLRWSVTGYPGAVRAAGTAGALLAVATGVVMAVTAARALRRTGAPGSAPASR